MDSLRVLVIDDEAGMRTAVIRALEGFQVRQDNLGEEFGFHVDQADSAETGLDMVKDSPVDILLLDYRLPGISGL